MKFINFIFIYLISFSLMASTTRELGFDVGTLKDQASSPSTPSAGKSKIYVKDNALKLLKSDGFERNIGSNSSQNLLLNGGFELGTSSWTNSAGTFTATSTPGEFSEETKAGKVVLSSQVLSLSQSVNTAAGIQKQGFVQAIYRIPATMADAEICSLVDAAEQTCAKNANLPGGKLIFDDTFRSIQIPLTFGTTSAGIKFKTTSTYSATAYFDGVILNQGLGLQNLQTDNVYSARISSSGTVSGENIDWISGNCTNANPFVCTFKTSLFSSTPSCVVSVEQNNNRGVQIISTSSTSISVTQFQTSSGTSLQDSNWSITCQKSGNDYLASSANVYSQASANYSFTSGTAITVTATTTNPTKGVIVTDTVIHQRNGQNMKAIYKFDQSSGGIDGVGDYLFTLPDSKQFDSSVTLYTGDVTGTGTATTTQKSLVGNGTLTNGASRADCTLFAYSLTQFRARCGTNFYGSPHFGFDGAIGFGFHIDAPISGWSQSGYVTGSFENVPTVPGAGARIDVFSATFGTTNATTACSASPCSFLNQIGTAISSVTRSSAGNYTVNTAKTYSKLFCLVGPSQSNFGAIMVNQCTTSSCTSFSILSRSLSNVDTDTVGTIQCQGTY